MAFGYMISKYTNEPVSVGYLFLTHKRVTVHLTTHNDESVCGRMIGQGATYSNTDEGVKLCLRCWRSFAKRECAADGGEAPDMGFQETGADNVTVNPMPSTPDMANVPRECYYGCSRPVAYAWVDYVGRTEGVCAHDVSRLMDEGREFYPVESEVITVDVTELIKGDMILGAEDMGLVRSHRPHVDTPTMHMVYGETYTDCFPAPYQVRVIRTVPYVVEGRVMVTIPGLTWPETGEPVELDEGTEHYIITPGYSNMSDLARMACMARYGKVNPNLRVEFLSHMGALNPQ